MKSKQAILIVSVLASLFLVAAFTTVALTYKEPTPIETPYILKAKENHVVLYKNGKVIEEFETVNYSALPEFDRNQLKKGIEYLTIDEVYTAIEDFDG